MSYQSRARKIINACGSNVQILLQSGTIETIASIQPLKYKLKSYFNEEYTSVGTSDDSKYLYIGPSDILLDTFAKDTILTNANGEYVLKSAGKFCKGDEIIYIWAILEKKVELN